MMTTMAALLGGLPLALGSGTGAELRRPLGIAIVGGLIVSQALTLVYHSGGLSLYGPHTSARGALARRASETSRAGAGDRQEISSHVLSLFAADLR